ncbi:MAG: rhodanese-like domain-containing protein [Hyalangium sp.]|uniref:rhodanese-like domain-containing protein n=1 Tax=Hyalangium sp. TaxID=2028555 RepID=UPI00389A0432
MELRIPCAELYLRLGDDDVLVLDCRSPDNWEQVEFHIPGSLRMTPEEVAQELFILPDDELIVLCGCAEDWENVLRLCQLLHLQGRNAVCLDGGIQAWVADGFPTERHLCPTPSLNGSHATAEGW